ncbi:hypothetical protein HIM_08615 [Hirsutella minnesotensis 3608]|uniref:Uncharacterized protein n=1 Tax=Hirsutella minnesotensis 3608 TaxID=1043627 RepID=A0A0F7ZY76_9HYPO|nr:hypothetical protein HIM_08615 [Hirsutella minnesotensis 3608]
MGFLYSYACLISSENNFFITTERRLLPRKADDSTILWADWKALPRELLDNHDPNSVHPRFLRAELRLSRINTIHRITHISSFDPYLRGWNNYGGLFHDLLVWMATATVVIALVLTAMQVALNTDNCIHQAYHGYGGDGSLEKTLDGRRIQLGSSDDRTLGLHS